MAARKTLDSIIASFRAAHGDRYSYEQVRYLGSTTKVSVICKVHGPFKVQPGHHATGVGCSRCYFEQKRLTVTDFVSRSVARFGDRYDYSAVVALPPSGEPVTIYCRLHGQWFSQDWRAHTRGHVGCKTCQIAKMQGGTALRGQVSTAADVKAEFVDRANAVHAGVYDYGEFVHQGARVPGAIRCVEHGVFMQAPYNHLRGTMCPRCRKQARFAGGLKAQCRELGVNYWRALKRREAGMTDDQVLDANVRRSCRATNPIVVNGVEYPNLEEAVRRLKPYATSTTIARWMRLGATPEDAFARVPNPGFAAGIVYTVQHVPSGLRYVGITICTMQVRWAKHVEDAAKGSIGSEASLHAAIRAHGPTAFIIDVVDRGTSHRDLGAKERAWIVRLGTFAPGGMNLSRGGEVGGSTPRRTYVDGQAFASARAAAEHVARTRGISLHAAKARLRAQRLDVQAPPKPG